jgi:hypothetical protein
MCCQCAAIPPQPNPHPKPQPHPQDVGVDPENSNPNTRIYMTRAAQPWHVDSSDVVALLCLAEAKVGRPGARGRDRGHFGQGASAHAFWDVRDSYRIGPRRQCRRRPLITLGPQPPAPTPQEGGITSWASSFEVINVIRQEAPELLPVLAGPWFLDRKGEVAPGRLPWFEMPVLHYHKVRRRGPRRGGGASRWASRAAAALGVPAPGPPCLACGPACAWASPLVPPLTPAPRRRGTQPPTTPGQRAHCHA